MEAPQDVITVEGPDGPVNRHGRTNRRAPGFAGARRQLIFTFSNENNYMIWTMLEEVLGRRAGCTAARW